jgi:hypothetical protein
MLIFEIDRIYRIIWISLIPGFRRKPGIHNPLRGKNYRRCQGSAVIHYLPRNHHISELSPVGASIFIVPSGDHEKILFIL